MTSLILYDNPASTNAHKVRLALAELGLEADRRLVVLNQPTGDARASSLGSGHRISRISAEVRDLVARSAPSGQLAS